MHDHLAALLRSGRRGHSVHGAAIKLGCIASTFLCNNILLSYLRHPVHVDARRLFDEMPRRNLMSWSVLISGSARLGALSEAFALFSDMLRGAGWGNWDRPDSFVLGALAAGCAHARGIAAGVQVHACTVKFGVDEDESVAAALVDMYAKCGRVDSSWRAFTLAPQRSVVSWTSMIACLVNHGSSGYQDTALVLFKKMLVLKVWPTNATFSCILKVLDVPELLPAGMQVHGCLLKMGTEVDTALGSALMTMYGRCGGVDEIARLACRIRHDSVSRTSLLGAYARNGYNVEAVGVFREMVTENMAIDQAAMTTLLQVCSSMGRLRMAREVHCYALKTFFKLDTLLLNATITVYSRCGDITGAEMVFNLMGKKDIISWTALLTGYAQNGLAQEVLLFFREMLRRGLGSPVFCITGVLRACSTTTNLAAGLQIHSRALKLGIDDDTSVQNALVTLYASCGSVQIAWKIFNSMSNRGIISWNSLLTSFSQHGNEVAAIQLFDMMQEAGVCPDDFTFAGLLSSCSRMGHVTQGCVYFKQMKEKYNLQPKMVHYTCMVDLFSRAGRFSDAMDLIDAMPCEPDEIVWEALLASCKVHGNVELGRIAARKILEIRPEDPSPYIILSSIHASVDMWDEKAWNRIVFDTQRARKDTGSSWIGAQELSENIFDTLQVGVTWENIIRETLNNISPDKPKYKCHSDPPSPSRFKPSDDAFMMEDELLSDSDSESDGEVHPLNEQDLIASVDGIHGNKCEHPADAPETILQDEKFSRLPSMKTFDRSHNLSFEESNLEEKICQKLLTKTLSHSERLGMVWPEPPLDMLAQCLPDNTKSLPSGRAIRTYLSFKSVNGDSGPFSEDNLVPDLNINYAAVKRKRPYFVRIISKQMVGVYLSIWVRKPPQAH